MAVSFDNFELDPELFELRRDGQPVSMEPQVFDVLRYLIEHRDRVVTKEELLDEVWGDRFVSESALTSRIKDARRVVDDDGAAQRLILTVRGRGYRFVGTVTAPTQTSAEPSVEPSVEPVGDPHLEPSATADTTRRPARAPQHMPSGTVAFLFTDVEGSTLLWEQQPDEMRRALERHDQLLTESIEQHGGFVFSTAGDSFAAAFAGVANAIDASNHAQRAIAAEPWPPSCPIRVRMGLHIGEAHERNHDYFGPAVNKTARLMAGGHGGQTLASASVAAVATGADLVDLGEHRLKDLAARERIFQVGSGSFPPLRTLEAVRHNLPVERTSLIGRDADVAHIGGLLREHRLVTLLGIGGTGKTRLAAAVAADQAEEYDDGVWFVDLVPATTGTQIAEAIASAAGLQLNESDVVSALAMLIANRKMLVVLDNCEHVTDEVADIVDVLLERTSGAHWLATSREPLQLPDERQVHVAPLAVDDDVASPAVQLFSAAAERVGVSVDADALSTVVDVCRKLDGLPLSIELAAAQLRHLALDELAARLDQRFEILTRGRGGRLRRQASLNAVLEDTWEMLDDSEQTLLVQLAAFPSEFNIADVEAISTGLGVAVPTRTLAGLVDRSLVASDGHCQRLLETVKLFARQRWATTGDPEQYLERHTNWVLGQLATFEPQEAYTSFEALAWAKAHYDDHRSVEDRLARAGRTAELATLLRALTLTYSYETGPRSAAAIERIAVHLVDLQLTDYERAHLNATAASAGLPARRPDWIARGAAAALPLIRLHGTSEEVAYGLILASWMRIFEDFDDAIAMLEEAQDIAEHEGAHALADVATAYLAGHHALGGQLDDARRILDELEPRLAGRPFDYAGSLYALFRMAVHLVTEPERSRATTTKLLVDIEIVANNSGIGWGFPACSAVTIGASGDLSGTRRAVFEAERDTRENSNDDGLPDLLLPIAALAWRLGATEQARHLLTAVRRSPTPTQNFQLTIMYRQLRGQVGLDDDNPLETQTIEEIYQEAKDWMLALDAASTI